MIDYTQSFDQFLTKTEYKFKINLSIEGPPNEERLVKE
jgi:hypothetical protein